MQQYQTSFDQAISVLVVNTTRILVVNMLFDTGDTQEEMVAKKFMNDGKSVMQYKQQMEVQNIADYMATLFTSTLKGKASGELGSARSSLVRYVTRLTRGRLQKSSNSTVMCEAPGMEFLK